MDGIQGLVCEGDKSSLLSIAMASGDDGDGDYDDDKRGAMMVVVGGGADDGGSTVAFRHRWMRRKSTAQEPSMASGLSVMPIQSSPV